MGYELIGNTISGIALDKGLTFSCIFLANSLKRSEIIYSGGNWDILEYVEIKWPFKKNENIKPKHK